MQLTLPSLLKILPQTAPDMRGGEVHAVLTENQRGHHYLEGLDLLAWGGCHLGLSLQLDSSDTTLLLRTGTGRAWNVSGRKCIVQDMRSPYLLWEREDLLSIAPPYTGLSNYTNSLYRSCFVESGRIKDISPLTHRMEFKTLLWLRNIKIAAMIIKTKNFNTVLPSKNRYLILLLVVILMLFSFPQMSSQEQKS